MEFIWTECLLVEMNQETDHKLEEKGYLLFIFNMVKYFLLCLLCLSGLLFRRLSNIHDLGLKPGPHVQVPCIHQLIDLQTKKKEIITNIFRNILQANIFSQHN